MIRLAVRVRPELAEIVLAELLECAPSGLEEVRREDGTIEFSVYGAPGELPSLPDLHAAVGDALIEVSTTRTADDWQERWKRFHRPVLIGPPTALTRAPGAHVPVPALGVRPPWEAPNAWHSGSVEDIVIDPGQAFGTGAHASTQLCLQLLLELAARAPGRGPLLDVGTGSGVLAIAAARLGFSPVIGLDHDRDSIDAARLNAQANDVPVEVRRFDIRSHPLAAIGAADGAAATIVVANLLLPLLLELARQLAFTPPHLLAGGLLREQTAEVAQAFGASLGMDVLATRERGEWAALWLVDG